MALKTRKPTGAVPWPLLLVEGEEKSGKTWSCAELTASDKVGRCFWIDLGEGAADEYGAIPGADYEVVEHDGTWGALFESVAEIHALAADALDRGEKPVVLIIDTMTSEWDLLKDWATDRAKSSRANRAKLERDPNAEIKVTTNYWNDANARHRNLMRLLKTFPGIVLMTAHGKPVAAMGTDGQPVEGKKEHKVEAQKTLGADASCWLRLYREEQGQIVGGRSVHLQFRPGDKPRHLASDWTLEGVIFDVLRCDPATARARDLVDLKADAVTPEQIRDEAVSPRTTVERVRELYREAKRLGYDDVIVINETGDDENLVALIGRIGREQAGTSQPQRAPAPGGRPDPVLTGQEDPWQTTAPARVVDPWDRDAQAAAAPPPPSRIRPEDQGARQPAASAPGEDDNAYVTDFMARLASAEKRADGDVIAAMLREIGSAIASKKVKPKTGGELADLARGKLTAARNAA